LITVSIHTTVTVVQFPSVETNPSITSAETRCVMDAATWVEEDTQVEEAATRNSVKV
jgi:hypothetical protein